MATETEVVAAVAAAGTEAKSETVTGVGKGVQARPRDPDRPLPDSWTGSFQCSVEGMRRAFIAAGAVVSTRPHSPVLTHCLVRVARNGEIEVFGTDLVRAVKVRVLATDVDTKGAPEFGVFLDPKQMRVILDGDGADEIEVKTDQEGGRIRIQRGRSKFWHPTIDAPETYPVWPAMDRPASVSVDSEAWREAVDRLIYATDSESQRYALDGILCRFRDNATVLPMVATDGRRLVTHKLSGATTGRGDDGADLDVVLATRFLKLTTSHCSPETPIEIECDRVRARFQAGNVTVLGRLVEGQFPRYEDVLRGLSEGGSCQVRAGDLLMESNKSLYTVSDESRAVKFEPKTGRLSGETELQLTGSGPTGRDCDIALRTSNVTGNPVTVSLDPNYVIAMARTFAPDTMLTMAWGKTHKEPIAFRDTEASRTLAVIMPLAMDS